jgi:glycosyltransferase involved in cell wall biosynthesis
MSSTDILVWVPVFNESKHIRSCIDSILSQSHKNIKLLISENHSTDNSAEIIKEYASIDSRIMAIRPPKFMSGVDHGSWLLSEVLNKINGFQYSCHLGAHDIISERYLELLLAAADENPNFSIIYGENIAYNEYSLDEKSLGPTGSFLRDTSIPIRPLALLTTLGWNSMVYGLWKEELRKKIIKQVTCKAVDHLYVAEMSILGDIIYSPEAKIKVRVVENDQKDYKTYTEKHIGSEYSPSRDLAAQLQWVADLTRRACKGHLHYENSAIMQVTVGATLSAYFARYCSLLLWEGGENFRRNFASDPNFLRLMGSMSNVTHITSEYINSTK